MDDRMMDILDLHLQGICPICKKELSKDRTEHPVKYVMYKGTQVAICVHHPIPH